MKLDEADSFSQRCYHGLKHIFGQIDEEDKTRGAVELRDGELNRVEGVTPPMTRGGSASSDDGESTSGELGGSVERGARSERWFERIENLVQDNRKRSVENQNMLMRMDFRTVWIARLLIGILVTVIGGIILQVFVV